MTRCVELIISGKYIDTYIAILYNACFIYLCTVVVIIIIIITTRIIILYIIISNGLVKEHIRSAVRYRLKNVVKPPRKPHASRTKSDSAADNLLTGHGDYQRTNNLT